MSDDAGRRALLRVPIRMEVTLKGDHLTVVSGQVRDLSLNGLYVAATLGLPPDSRCEVVIALGGPASDVKLSLRGRVARVDRGGMGIEFVEMGLDTFFHLRNLVRYNSFDAARVDEEFRAYCEQKRL
jgi:PilZ domain